MKGRLVLILKSLEFFSNKPNSKKNARVFDIENFLKKEFI